MKGWSTWGSCTCIVNSLVERAEVRAGEVDRGNCAVLGILFTNNCKYSETSGVIGRRLYRHSVFGFRGTLLCVIPFFTISYKHANHEDLLETWHSKNALSTPNVRPYILSVYYVFFFFFSPHREDNWTSRVRIYDRTIGRHDRDIVIKNQNQHALFCKGGSI